MRLYTVLPYDSLNSIAQKFGITYQQIMFDNHLASYTLRVGQELVLSTVSEENVPEIADCIDERSIEVYNVDENIPIYEPEANEMYPIAVETGVELPEVNVWEERHISERSGGGATYYTVRSGDSLSKIANKFNVTVDAIKRINKLDSNVIHVGQILKIPATTTVPAAPPTPSNTTTSVQQTPIYYMVVSGDSLGLVAKKKGVSVDDLVRWNKLKNAQVGLLIGQKLIVGYQKNTTNTTTSTPPTLPPATQTPIYYMVVSGDSLGLVAKKKGVSVDDLVRWNKLKNAQVGLLIGQKLIVGYQKNTTNNNTTTPSPAPTVPPPTTAQPLTMPALVFAFDRTQISSSVGQGGINRSNDVRIIQNALLRSGFLSPEDHQQELAADNSSPISAQQIVHTIAAITNFNQIVADIDTNIAIILPNSHSLMYLNTVAEMPQSDTVAAARSTLIVEEKSAQIIFSEGLTGSVGNTNFGNKVADVRKVQQALRLWGYSISNNETPAPTEQLPIDPLRLPQTIAAIRQFQDSRVDYWRGNRDVTGSTTYIDGLVGMNETDLTYNILKAMAEYTANFMVGSAPQTCKFRNLQRTPYTVDLGGVSIIGNVLPTSLSLKEYENFGLNRTQAKALQYVSEHEGNFDAINSYDRAIFSYGFIQFAGGGRGLAPMLAMIKHSYPNAFKQRFQQYGIDVEYSMKDGDIESAQIAVFDLRVKRWVRRAAAENLLKNDKLLTTIFVRAAYHPDIQRGQIASAARKYVTAALNIRFSKHLKIGDSIVPCGNKLMTQIMRSEKALTVLIDLTVNRWTVATRDLFETAIGKIAYLNQLNTFEKLCTIDENAVLRQMIQQGDLLVQKRVRSVLENNDLSNQKS
jgi:peptidoglycan endopeptidase LytF